MRTIQSILSLGLVLGSVTAAHAATIDVPLDAGVWFQYPHIYQVDGTAGTVANTPDGHLVLTKTTPTGGTPWFLGRDAVGTYDLQDATLQYQWKLDGLGTYAGAYSGLLTEAHGGLYYGVPFTVGWQFSTSVLIPNDTWLYTEWSFYTDAGAHMLDWSVSSAGYGGGDIVSLTGLAVSDASWTALATAHPFVQLVDNYAAGAHLELAAMTITAAAVPEPQTGALMLAGLGLLGLMARRAGR